ncbi:MFS transporter [Pseudofrankia inefficax]|uniref:Major facilitator superfamily MFS_1 n=1 Tax=Pseudofrankia inefficax (strain DSM 45817 / CECT 9037 / DDB 130130 / EuI1c) TaxID=298654 RepID=E3IU16_PSEI1|nr:nitrate/nitrite transporter [Pseudofrankia inefficax]ADP81209.1 major facilitator superfamily MFS_1 [Pseudofrankia inefficax]
MKTVLEDRSVATRPVRAHRARRGWILDWRPEDTEFWADRGSRIAHRNLAFSILAEHVGLSVWSLWSVLVLFLGPEYHVDAPGRFLLTTAPILTGAALRLPYMFGVARFGGRAWTTFCATTLLVPTVLTAILLRPGVPYAVLLALAALAGAGGGTFASSMANINAFFPKRQKGRALGLNAGGGNVGVAAVQLVGLLIFTTTGAHRPRLILAVYIPLVVLAALGAYLGMDGLPIARTTRQATREVIRNLHTWILSALYVGTFGSFIGFSFAFGQVLQLRFAARFPSPADAMYLTFLGPLLGSLARPVGGVIADRFGGSRVTVAAFVTMTAAAVLVLVASWRTSLALFMVGFVALFVVSGIGNGSTFALIPEVGRAQAARAGDADQDGRARYLTSGIISAAGAAGAAGGALVTIAFRESFLLGGDGTLAYVAFIAYYLICLVLLWCCYGHPRAVHPGGPPASHRRQRGAGPRQPGPRPGCGRILHRVSGTGIDAHSEYTSSQSRYQNDRGPLSVRNTRFPT